MEDVIEVYVRENDVDTKIDSQPQTIKELFTEFKPSNNLTLTKDESDDESEFREDEDDEFEPPRKQRKKSLKNEDGSPKKRMYLQRYRKEWENIPAYRPWLSESTLGNLYFYCKFCKNNNKCGRTEIDKHMTCRKHIRNSKIPQHRVQKKFTFRGLLCPVFTPFTRRENDVNYSIISEYAKYLLSCGVTGILINDVLGEGMSLTPAERMKITEEWVKACEQTKQHLMVQVGGAPLKEVQEMVRHAEKKRVGSLLVLPDVYNKPKDHFDLMRYIKLVSDCATTVPLLYHHYPAYTGININMSKFLNDILGEIDSFVGIIYSDNNLSDGLSALQVNEDKFNVFMGSDEIMLGALACGFNSILGSTLNFLPKVAQTISEAVKVGNIKDAKKAQDLLKNVLEGAYRHGESLPAIKAVMNLLTPINVGAVRDPLVPIWQDKVAKIKSELQLLKLMPANKISKE